MPNAHTSQQKEDRRTCTAPKRREARELKRIQRVENIQQRLQDLRTRKAKKAQPSLPHHPRDIATCRHHSPRCAGDRIGKVQSA